MATKKDAFVGQRIFEYPSNTGTLRYTPRIAFSFITYLLVNKNLPIDESLNLFDKSEYFFLIAGTGLGKTVVMPVYLWFRHMHFTRYYSNFAEESVIPKGESPRIWVVEPKLAIVQGLHAEMNEEWDRWQTKTKSAKYPPLFGCKTKVDHRDFDAPIMFITTGIFAIYARKGLFQQGRDIVLIDEAHVTLETDESVELAIGICNAAKVPVQFMSATVKPDDLAKRLRTIIVDIPGKRFPLWRHNTKRPLEECIVALVETALVRQDTLSEYFPQGKTEADIVKAVTEGNRTKGMLIIVNSFSGEQSDARRIERLLQKSPLATQFEIGLLASETLRDRKRKAAYEAMLERWKQKKKRYVLIATSVVEMGVTLPDLDFVVTMDSGFGESDGARLSRVALGTNTLIQRIGRVGRERPGIAYITREVDAPYSSWDDATLNAEGALLPESINFPMAQGPLTCLAYETMVRNWGDSELKAGLATLHLPTNILADAERYQQLGNERSRLWSFGIHDGYNMTPIGKQLERWIGRIDPMYAVAAHEVYARNETDSVLRILCTGVLEEFPLDGAPSGANLYHDFVLLLVRWMSGAKSDRHNQRRLIDHIQRTLSERNLHEQALFRALTLLAEHLETFVDVVDEKRGPHQPKLAPLLAWRQTILTFLRMRTST